MAHARPGKPGARTGHPTWNPGVRPLRPLGCGFAAIPGPRVPALAVAQAPEDRLDSAPTGWQRQVRGPEPPVAPLPQLSPLAALTGLASFQTEGTLALAVSACRTRKQPLTKLNALESLCPQHLSSALFSPRRFVVSIPISPKLDQDLRHRAYLARSLAHSRHSVNTC